MLDKGAARLLADLELEIVPLEDGKDAGDERYKMHQRHRHHRHVLQDGELVIYRQIGFSQPPLVVKDCCLFWSRIFEMIEISSLSFNGVKF